MGPAAVHFTKPKSFPYIWHCHTLVPKILLHLSCFPNTVMLPSCLQSDLKTITKLAFLLKAYSLSIYSLHYWCSPYISWHSSMASLLFAQCYVSKNNSHLKKEEMGLEKNWIQTVPGCWRNLHPGWIRKMQVNLIIRQIPCSSVKLLALTACIPQ